MRKGDKHQVNSMLGRHRPRQMQPMHPIPSQQLRQESPVCSSTRFSPLKDLGPVVKQLAERSVDMIQAAEARLPGLVMDHPYTKFLCFY